MNSISGTRSDYTANSVDEEGHLAYWQDYRIYPKLQTYL